MKGVSACKRLAAKLLIRPLVFLMLAARYFRMRWQVACMRQYGHAYELLPALPTKPAGQQKIVAVITHVCRPDAHEPLKKGEASRDRLQNTIEGLITSFSHCDLRIVLNTYRDWNVLAGLPPELKARLEIVTHQEGDPMFLGFHVPDLFARYRTEADWFIALEDDIVIQDATFLDKLAFFNAAIMEPTALLMPHRYETWQGRKFYIDLRWPHDDFRAQAWSGPSMIRLGQLEFGQCSNSHSACYFLNRAQLQLWLDSPRAWQNRMTGAGPLESWGSVMLNEVFHLYKAGPANLHFLEVRHWQPTYFQRLLKFEQEKNVSVKCHTAE